MVAITVDLSNSTVIDLLNLKEGSAQRTLANLGNNTVPFGGLRNEVGKVLWGRAFL